MNKQKFQMSQKKFKNKQKLKKFQLTKEFKWLNKRKI